MPYPDDHPQGGAFLANRLNRLSDLIATQGDELLRDAGLDLPSRAVSLMLIVGERGPLSVADAAALLEQPHQLVTQRAEVLISLGLIERRDDPADGRRKFLTLSAASVERHARLQAFLSDAADVFATLSEEIGCDLSAMVAKTQGALERVSLLDRMKQRAPGLERRP